MIWGMVPASRGLGTSAVNHVLFFFCIRTSGFHSLMSLFDPLSCFLICLNLHFVVVTDINVNLRWNWSIFLLSLSPSLVNYSHLHSGISNHVLTPWYISVQISWLKYLVYHIFLFDCFVQKQILTYFGKCEILQLECRSAEHLTDFIWSQMKSVWSTNERQPLWRSSKSLTLIWNMSVCCFYLM